MQFVSEWVTPDHKRLVVFAPAVIEVFTQFRQRFFWQSESGGILIGSRRGQHIEVSMATRPMPTDRGWQFSFVREATGHAEAARLAWQAGGQMVDYVGEWHTHPERVPVPSGVDRIAWSKLAANRSAPTPLITVIVGTTRLHVELLTGGGQANLNPINNSLSRPL